VGRVVGVVLSRHSLRRRPVLVVASSFVTLALGMEVSGEELRDRENELRLSS
jgi:hypothetical protein